MQKDDRVELIRGQVVTMSPIGPPHNALVDRALRLLVRAVNDRAIVRVQGSVQLDEYSESQPDIALLRPRQDFYYSAHPRPDDIFLIVEIRSSRTPAAARALRGATGAAIFFAAVRTGRVSRGSDHMERIVADDARTRRGMAPFIGQGIETADEGIPVQGDPALALAALDRHEQPLDRHEDLQPLAELNHDPQTVLLLQVCDLRLVLPRRCFDPQLFPRSIALLPALTGIGFLTKAFVVLEDALQIAV